MNNRVHFGLAALVAIATIISGTVAHRHWNNNNNTHHYGSYGGYRPRHQHHQHQHHHHRHGRWYPSLVPTFEIYEPKGLEVYIADRNQSAQYFAIAVFINAANTSDDVPAVLQNTSNVVYGKFIVQDPSVIIKPGDTVSYKAQVGFKNGQNKTIVHRFIVRYDMIRRNCTCYDGSRPTTYAATTEGPYISRRANSSIPTQVPCIASTTPNSSVGYSDERSDDQYECEIDPQTNLCKSSLQIDQRVSSDKNESAPLANRERQVLEGIIDYLQNQCGFESRTNYLTLPLSTQEESVVLDPAQYVQQKLSTTNELQQLVKQSVREAHVESDLVVFEMRTALDKLKVLYLCKEANIPDVEDYDFTSMMNVV
uniref:Putative secreted protein n=1 Tax=Anopheles triannulatus TaxID=58253 RepID=A0A2M4AD43_9DIPT